MNRIDLLEEIKKQSFWNEKLLDSKELHTRKKVELLQEYMNRYIQVQANHLKENNGTNYIDFIDAMCNAGIYVDGDLCTSMEVLNVFIGNVKKYPHVEFSIFLNDIDEKRIACSKWLYQRMIEENDSESMSHIHVFFSCMDVNKYLSDKPQIPMSSKNRAQVIWLDPYNFGTIKISNILKFLHKRYCELFYNVFTSDFQRNYITGNIPSERVEVDVNSLSNAEGLMQWIQETLKTTGKMKFCFAYSFQNLKNVEMYKILFATPNIAGLKKFKETLFSVFEGHPIHSNRTQYSDLQPSLFGDEEEKRMYAEEAGKQAIDIFFEKFRNIEMSYNEIESFLLESTMLAESHVINCFLKPLIKEKRIEKENKVKCNRNYKEDYYKINS